MLRTARHRQPERPAIVTQTIYHHHMEVEESSSEASFLKLSEWGSQENKKPGQDPFFEIEAALGRMRQRSRSRLGQITVDLNRQLSLQGAGMDGRLQEKGEWTEFNKQNPNLTFRKLYGHSYQKQSSQDNNFEMDQHRNYVRQDPSHPSSNTLTPITIEPLQTREDIFSLQNSRKVSKQQFYTLGNRNSNPFSEMDLEKINTILNKEQTERPISTNRISVTRRKGSPVKPKRKSSTFSQKSQVKKSGGGIYESILSLYTTSKLLAMEKRLK